MMQDLWAYCRVSTTKTDQELSLEEQERWARSVAADAGAEVKVYQERASAKTTLGRPIFQGMMADLQAAPAAKRPKRVLVTSLDRLSRDMTDTLVAARAMRELRVELFVRDVGVIKADTFAQRAALVGQSMGGEAENEARSNRMKASWERRRREGKPTSNKVPYGLQLVAERDAPAKGSSDWVRTAFELYASGVGAYTIAVRFKEGAPPHTVQTRVIDDAGKPIVRSRHHAWEYNRIMKLLRQPRYRGTIVNPELFDRVQALMASKPRWRQDRQAEYPLSGAVKCGTCGRSFHGHSISSSKRRLRYYYCVVCLYSIPADKLEAWFRADVGKLTASDSLLRRWVSAERLSGDKVAAKREIAKLERQTAPDAIEAARARVWELALAGKHAAADLERQLSRIDLKSQTERAHLQELRSAVDQSNSRKRTFEQARELLAGFWTRYERASYEDKRSLMGALVAALGGATATKAGLVWHKRLKPAALGE